MATVQPGKDCWYDVRDPRERKKIQDRLAQRARSQSLASLPHSKPLLTLMQGDVYRRPTVTNFSRLSWMLRYPALAPPRPGLCLQNAHHDVLQPWHRFQNRAFQRLATIQVRPRALMLLAGATPCHLDVVPSSNHQIAHR